MKRPGHYVLNTLLPEAPSSFVISLRWAEKEGSVGRSVLPSLTGALNLPTPPLS